MRTDDMFSRERPTAVVFCENFERFGRLEALATACECDVWDKEYGRRNARDLRPADFLLWDICSISEQFEQSLSDVAGYLKSHSSSALIWTDMDRLEVAYAALPTDRCHFLIDADDAEAVPILAGIYGRSKMEQLHDKSRATGFGALHRISDELASFARTLAQIAETDAENHPPFAEKPVSFRPAPAGSFQPFPVTLPDNAISSASIREMIKQRRLRDSYFDSGLFADPAWDILLDLMAAALDGQSVSVSSLCIAAAVPPTTALRWITAMTESGMLVRRHDPDDARRVFIGLAENVEASMRQYLADIQQRSSVVR